MEYCEQVSAPFYKPKPPAALLAFHESRDHAKLKLSSVICCDPISGQLHCFSLCRPSPSPSPLLSLGRSCPVQLRLFPSSRSVTGRARQVQLFLPTLFVRVIQLIFSNCRIFQRFCGESPAFPLIADHSWIHGQSVTISRGSEQSRLVV